MYNIKSAILSIFMCLVQFIIFFFFFFWLWHVEVPRPGAEPNHSNDNARSFNWQATEELQLIFLRVFLCFSWGKKVPRPRTLLTLPSPQSSPTDAVGGSTTTARTHTHTYPSPTLAKTIMILERVTACWGLALRPSSVSKSQSVNRLVMSEQWGASPIPEPLHFVSNTAPHNCSVQLSPPMLTNQRVPHPRPHPQGPKYTPRIPWYLLGSVKSRNMETLHLVLKA